MKKKPKLIIGTTITLIMLGVISIPANKNLNELAESNNVSYRYHLFVFPGTASTVSNDIQKNN